MNQQWATLILLAFILTLTRTPEQLTQEQLLTSYYEQYQNAVEANDYEKIEVIETYVQNEFIYTLEAEIENEDVRAFLVKVRKY